MMRARTSTLVVGYPLVTVPLFLLDGFLGFEFTVNGGFNWGTVFTILFAGWLANCAKEAGRYRAWRREWDALDPNHHPQRSFRNAFHLMAGLMIATPVSLGVFWLVTNYSNPNSAAHLIGPLLLVALPVLWIVARLLRRRKRRQPQPQEWIVAQAISRPLPSPSVAEAFARLPDYCRLQARKDHA